MKYANGSKKSKMRETKNKVEQADGGGKINMEKQA